LAEDKALSDDSPHHNGGLKEFDGVEHMDNGVKAKLGALVDEIRKGSAYQGYTHALAELGRDEQCMRKLKDFKRAETQYWQLGRKAVSLEEEKMLSYGYSELTLNEKIRVFLEKERELCEVLTNVYAALGEISPAAFDEA
jgi:cell fate (sporulation/competence/biofilm development) regulator YlbF (YheA/YmcA/DUF963 family)